MGKGCIHYCVDNGEEGCALELQSELIYQPDVNLVRGQRLSRFGKTFPKAPLLK